MKLFLTLLITSLLFQFWMPWWVIMALPFLLCFWLAPSARQAFFASFIASCLLWGLAALFIQLRSGAIIAERVSLLLKLNSTPLLTALTALTGGLAAGVAGWAGYLWKGIFQPAKVHPGKAGPGKAGPEQSWPEQAGSGQAYPEQN